MARKYRACVALLAAVVVAEDPLCVLSPSPSSLSSPVSAPSSRRPDRNVSPWPASRVPPLLLPNPLTLSNTRPRTTGGVCDPICLNCRTLLSCSVCPFVRSPGGTPPASWSWLRPQRAQRASCGESTDNTIPHQRWEFLQLQAQSTRPKPHAACRICFLNTFFFASRRRRVAGDTLWPDFWFVWFLVCSGPAIWGDPWDSSASLPGPHLFSLVPAQ